MVELLQVAEVVHPLRHPIGDDEEAAAAGAALVELRLQLVEEDDVVVDVLLVLGLDAALLLELGDGAVRPGSTYPGQFEIRTSPLASPPSATGTSSVLPPPTPSSPPHAAIPRPASASAAIAADGARDPLANPCPAVAASSCLSLRHVVAGSDTGDAAVAVRGRLRSTRGPRACARAPSSAGPPRPHPGAARARPRWRSGPAPSSRRPSAAARRSASRCPGRPSSRRLPRRSAGRRRAGSLACWIDQLLRTHDGVAALARAEAVHAASRPPARSPAGSSRGRRAGRVTVPGIRLETPMKPATKVVARPLVDVLGRADLLDAAVRHHRDPVRHRQRLLLVVGHVDERDPDLALDPLQLELQPLAELQVERAERLVEQQHLGQVDERAGQRHPLLLAARELVRPAVDLRGEARPARAPRPPAR